MDAERQGGKRPLVALAMGDPAGISPELAAVLQRALAVAKETDGAFDPTIRPLADLWGFIVALDDEQRLALLAHCGPCCRHGFDDCSCPPSGWGAARSC